eukprot:753048-Hanusia_phi.AAC.2
MQYTNNDILTDCVLREGFKEFRIYCGDMEWVLLGTKKRLHAGGKFWADAQSGTTASASVDIEPYDGDDANPNDLILSSFTIDTSPKAAFIEEEPDPFAMPGGKGKSLGMVKYKKHDGKVFVATCLPYGRVKSEEGQIFERVDTWLQCVQQMSE